MKICARILAAFILLVAPLAARADTFTWNDADGVWSDPNAWSGAVAPPGGSPPDSLTFGATASSNSTNDLIGASVNSIAAVGNTVGLFGNQITMAGAGAAVTSDGNLGINNAVDLSASVGVAGSGTVTFAGPITGGGQLSYGGTGTAVINSGGNTYSGGTVVNSGTVIVQAASTLGTGNTTVNGGTLIVNGSANNVAINSGALVKGTGAITGTLDVNSGSVISPGSSAGTMLVLGDANFNNGGIYFWEINDFLGTPGGDPGWDLLSITGTLDVNSLITDKFVIRISGTPMNFVHTSTLIIATAAGGITGFDASLFSVEPTYFYNSVGGVWSISQSGNNLLLTFTVPEPSSVMLWVTGLGLIGSQYIWRRRARQAASV